MIFAESRCVFLKFDKCCLVIVVFGAEEIENKGEWCKFGPKLEEVWFGELIGREN